MKKVLGKWNFARAGELVLEAAQQQDADQYAEDRVLDVVRLPGPRSEEPAVPALLALRQVAQPDRHQPEDRDQAGPAEELADPLEDEPVADHRQHPVRVEQLPERGHQAQEQPDEAERDEPVQDADVAPLQHPGVQQRLLGQRRRALPRVVGAADRLAQLDDGHDVPDRLAEQRDPDSGDRERDDDGEDLHTSDVIGWLPGSHVGVALLTPRVLRLTCLMHRKRQVNLKRPAVNGCR